MVTQAGNTKSGEDSVKRTTIALLTFTFVGFYLFGIVGVWNGDTAANSKAITLLQPIVYVIIGYYFGRLPAERTEKQLKDDAKEKGKQAQEASALAQQAMTKLGTVRTLLSGTAGATAKAPVAGFAANLSGSTASYEDAMKITIAHAVNVIDG